MFLFLLSQQNAKTFLLYQVSFYTEPKNRISIFLFKHFVHDQELWTRLSGWATMVSFYFFAKIQKLTTVWGSVAKAQQLRAEIKFLGSNPRSPFS